MRVAADWLMTAEEAEWGLRIECSLAGYWAHRGLQEEAFHRIQQFLSLPAADSRPKLKAKALITLSDMASFSGRHSERERLNQESLAFLETLNDPRGMLMLLTHAGVAARGIANYPSARSYFERAVEVARELGDSAGLAGALSNLADVVRLQEEYELSRLLLLEAARLFEEIGNPAGAAWCLSHQADIAREQKDWERSRSLYEQALSRFRTLDHPIGIASCHQDLAGLLLDQKDYGNAQRLYLVCLKLFWELKNPTDLPRLLESLATCAAALQEPERAVTLIGAAASVRQQLVRPLQGAAKNKIEQVLTSVRERMSSTTATECWMRGWTTQPEDAVTFALGGENS
jgi:tetratricopeptide (TPR) repeat protein